MSRSPPQSAALPVYSLLVWIPSCPRRSVQMPMSYTHTAIRDEEIPRASAPVFQHTLQTYASETNKVISVWREFRPEHLSFNPHERSSSVAEIFKHQILSERRFFGEF